MSLNKIFIMISVVSLGILGLQSCYKVATVAPSNTIEITGPVSFANDIMPIINTKCNMSGCHNAGGIKPNLSPESIYNVLNTGGYINKDDPAKSNLYLWLIGQAGSIMPPGGPNNPSNINEYVLAWIEQGAENN